MRTHICSFSNSISTIAEVACIYLATTHFHSLLSFHNLMSHECFSIERFHWLIEIYFLQQQHRWKWHHSKYTSSVYRMKENGKKWILTFSKHEPFHKETSRKEHTSINHWKTHQEISVFDFWNIFRVRFGLLDRQKMTT